MQQYRLRSPVFSADQWWPSLSSAFGVSHCEGNDFGRIHVDGSQPSHVRMTVYPGDWIVVERTENGLFVRRFVVRPDEFQEKYEPLSEQADQPELLAEGRSATPVS